MINQDNKLILSTIFPLIIRYTWNKRGMPMFGCFSQFWHNGTISVYLPKLHRGCSLCASCTPSWGLWFRRTCRQGIMCDRVTRWLARWISKNTVMCLIRLGRFFKIGHHCIKLASVSLKSRIPPSPSGTLFILWFGSLIIRYHPGLL